MRTQKYFRFFVLFFVLSSFLYAQKHTVVESTNNYVIISFDFDKSFEIRDTLVNGLQFQKIVGNAQSFRNIGEPWLPSYFVSVGIARNFNPSLEILSIEKEVVANKFILPYPDNDSYYESFNLEITDPKIYGTNKLFPDKVADLLPDYVARYARIQPILVNPFQFNPVTRELVKVKRIQVKVNFGRQNNLAESVEPIYDSYSNRLLKNTVINYKQAINWVSKSKEFATDKTIDDWYNPNKKWYKIFLNKRTVYRISYNEFVNLGVTFPEKQPLTTLQIFNNGNAIPIEITDNGDSVFNSGDYIEFVGDNAPPSPYSKINIYNLTNVYWFTNEADTDKTLRYKHTKGYPDGFTSNHPSSKHFSHFEVDSIYENLGHAGDEKRDFWYWGTTIAENKINKVPFVRPLPGMKEVDIAYPIHVKVNLHGMTDTYCQNGVLYAHNVNIYFNNRLIGTAKWDGQQPYTFEKYFYVEGDTVPIYPDFNAIGVVADGDNCIPVSITNSDVVRINWVDVTYSRVNRVNGNLFQFYDDNIGSPIKRHWLTQWKSDTMRVFVPRSNKLIDSVWIVNDQYESAVFVDTTNIEQEYFCVGLDVFETIDSLKPVAPIYLKQMTNGADYLIIYHPSLLSVAERLKNIRENNFPDTSIQNPRIKLINIFDLYDGFTAGFLDPLAPYYFVKYAFENYQSPAPLYVTLVGDMSSDYRKVFQTSRPNFIPSPPYYSYTFGQSASDNAIVAVTGDDVMPDLAIGRISVETEAEGNIYLDRIENYPADISKKWKETILLLSSGINDIDENKYKFNDATMSLNLNYVGKNGFSPKMIFKYPNLPIYEKYRGSTPEIRQAINQGGVLLNYYGHGGGMQWDATFSRDDIYVLQNAPRYTWVSSVTCYTAHFINQDVFGELFIKLPEKGAVGFFGSAGLTNWEVGKYINGFLFDEFLTKKTYISGLAILNSKNRVPSGFGSLGNQIALLTLLGEPLVKLAFPEKYDFTLKNNYINMRPPNPIVGDTLSINVKLENQGIILGNDSVSVELYFQSPDTSGFIGKIRIPVFANEDSVSFTFIPKYGGLYKFEAKINLVDSLSESDYSDNIASSSFAIYSLDEPSILYPIDGYTTDSSFVTIKIMNVGSYINKSLEYVIEIDTSHSFSNPIYRANIIKESEVIDWKTPNLPPDFYFWRARIIDGANEGRWSKTKTFRNMTTPKKGAFFTGKQLTFMDKENLLYSKENQHLFLNTSIQPPRPEEKKILEDITLDTLTDKVDYTCLATDGKYLYIANLAYFSYFNDTTGNTRIYKFGTGNEGTIKGKYYGTIPNFYHQISYTIFYHSDGFLYAVLKDPRKIIKIDLVAQNNNIDTVDVPSGFINYSDSRVKEGSFFVTSDSMFVYNLATYDTNGNNRYTLRVFNPANNWSLVQEIYYPTIESFIGVSGFFVARGYFYPYENFNSGTFARIQIQGGNVYDDMWTAMEVHGYNVEVRFYAWAYDWKYDKVYATNFGRVDSLKKTITKFVGTYLDAKGKLTTNSVGIAGKWNSIDYDINGGGDVADYHVSLLGYNKNDNIWDTLAVNIPRKYNIESVNNIKYPYVRLDISIVDSSLSSINPISVKDLSFNYTEPTELILTQENLIVSPDSIMQGFQTGVTLKVENYGKTKADSVLVKFLLDDSDSVYYQTVLSVDSASSTVASFVVPTDTIVLQHQFRALLGFDKPEYFSFNNTTHKSFFITRDSLKPSFKITFDDKEILNGDLISKKPKVRISLKDDSPLPLDTSMFTIILDNVPLGFTKDKMQFYYTPYPNSEAIVELLPTLKQGRHILDVLAKDASGNFFDTTFNRSIFYVYEKDNIDRINNFPNPFTNDTYFYFELQGDAIPDEIKIRIFTIAGRLIKEFDLRNKDYRIGFNKIYWDGKDNDGDDIANGVYLYKVIAKYPEQTRTETMKLVRMR